MLKMETVLHVFAQSGRVMPFPFSATVFDHVRPCFARHGRNFVRCPKKYGEIFWRKRMCNGNDVKEQNARAVKVHHSRAITSKTRKHFGNDVSCFREVPMFQCVFRESEVKYPLFDFGLQ
jgi:hypothetical protein